MDSGAFTLLTAGSVCSLYVVCPVFKIALLEAAEAILAPEAVDAFTFVPLDTGNGPTRINCSCPFSVFSNK